MATGEMVRVTTEDGHVMRLGLDEFLTMMAIAEHEVEAVRAGDVVVIENGWKVELVEVAS